MTLTYTCYVPVTFDIKLRSKVCFSVAVIAASVKHCTVIVLGILYDQTLSPGPEVIKLFSCSSQLNIKFQLLLKQKC